MDYSVASTDDIDSVVPEEFGGMWFFRDALGCENLGMTLLELEPDAEGKPHDHAGEGHEEVYLVVDGELTIELGDEEGSFESEETLAAGEAVRVAADTWRRVENDGDEPVRVAVAGAP
jgi:quercetin dioxygenase-like cupin family protein